LSASPKLKRPWGADHEDLTMLWLYAWTAAPYVIQLAGDCLFDLWNGRASVADCAERLARLAL